MVFSAKRMGLVLLLVCLAAGAYSEQEIRIWTDVEGGQVEAEFVREVFGSVTLLTREGRRINIDVERLSPEDVTFLRTRILPELDISFSRTTSARSPSQFSMPGSMITTVNGRVTIRKSSRNPFDGELTAELFMIGQEFGTSTYRLSGKTKESFRLTRANRDQHSFQYPVELFRFTDMNSRDERGQVFAGYVVIVRDGKGRLAGWSSDLRWMTQDKLAALERMNTGGWFNESLRRAPVPRAVYQNPGRWLD